jgi:WD40 repeat protein
LNPDLPQKLEDIIERALEKERELRYQGASEMRSESMRLKRDRSSGRIVTAKESAPEEFSPAPASPTVTASGADRRSAIAATVRIKSISIVLTAVLIVAVVDISFYLWTRRTARVPFKDMKVSAVTSGGDALAAALSPDGNYVATLRQGTDGRASLWMRHLATNSNVEVLPPSFRSIADLTFSPDGGYLYFRSGEFAAMNGDLYRVPVLGGTPTLITRDVSSAPSFTASLPGSALFASNLTKICNRLSARISMGQRKRSFTPERAPTITSQHGPLTASE